MLLIMSRAPQVKKIYKNQTRNECGVLFFSSFWEGGECVHQQKCFRQQKPVSPRHNRSPLFSRQKKHKKAERGSTYLPHSLRKRGITNAATFLAFTPHRRTAAASRRAFLSRHQLVCARLETRTAKSLVFDRRKLA